MDDNVLQFLKNVVRKYLPETSYKAFVFGSRALGNSRNFSDIDLGLMGQKQVPIIDRFAIEEEFENSNLPYRIDLVDFSNVSDKFKSVALKKVINI